MELSALIKKIDELRDRIQQRRPLSPLEIKELDNFYRVGLTYTSNALEGNSLTLTETKVLLENGLTVGGKPVKDCYEATGHALAYDFMLSIAKAKDLAITEEVILRLHFLFYNGIDSEYAGKYRKHQVIITGTEYVPPESSAVPQLMKDFIIELDKKAKELHPVLLSAFAHRRLVDIHPFSDGNGRTARLLMNLILINKGYCIVSIPPVLRNDYISALIMAQREKNPSDAKFNELIAICENESQREYCRLFHIPITDNHS
jgi:Fic family protein